MLLLLLNYRKIDSNVLSFMKNTFVLGVIYKPCGPGRGEGGFQIVHVSPQEGRGVNRMVHVDFFSGLEYLFF